MTQTQEPNTVDGRANRDEGERQAGEDAPVCGAARHGREHAQGESEGFSAILTPHRSLGSRGFLILMVIVCTVSFGAGMLFWAAGAWPVLGFFGLDVALVYVAFRINYRAARLYETVELAGDRLVVTRVEPSGRCRRWAFHPYWAQVHVEESPRGGVRLMLASHGRRLVFGHFLSDEEKRDFASAFGAALRGYRGSLGG